jgi:hypothetical protein
MIDSGFAMPRPPTPGAIVRGIAPSQRVHPAASPACRGAAARLCGALCAIALALAAGSVAATPPTLAGCPLFPADHVWNVAVDTLPVDANSAAYVATIGTGKYVHPDFGTVYAGAPNGIPYVVVDATQPAVAVTFDYNDESDPGPYPVPANAPIEGGAQSGGDRHVLVVDSATCKLYEMFAAYPNGNGSWHAGSGAVYDLRGYALRPSTWTSADAAGLPMLPGLVRYDEVAAGEIAHALRFTAPQTRSAFIWPARHQASSLTGSAYPPMGQRFRMKASVDISKFVPNVQVILRALKKYGMFLADNGSSWYVSGVPDPRWSDDELHQIQQLHGSDFEAVDESSLIVDANSARAATGATSPVAIEFYRAAADHYFISADPAEILKLDTGVLAGWARTGQAFAVYPAADSTLPNHSPVCRFYGRPEAGLDSHFYSASPAECQAVIDRFSNAWIYESGDVFAVSLPSPADGSCAVGTLPLYRLYNNRADVNHRYTTSLVIQAQMVAAGWIAEGYGPHDVAMCVPGA